MATNAARPYKDEVLRIKEEKILVSEEKADLIKFKGSLTIHINISKSGLGVPTEALCGEKRIKAHNAFSKEGVFRDVTCPICIRAEKHRREVFQKKVEKHVPAPSNTPMPEVEECLQIGDTVEFNCYSINCESKSLRTYTGNRKGVIIQIIPRDKGEDKYVIVDVEHTGIHIVLKSDIKEN